MFDWTKFTTDPCDQKVQIEMHRYLLSIRCVEYIDYMRWLLKKVQGKSCLDIGAVEHNLSYTQMPSWKHKDLAKVTSKLVGVDILEEYAQILNQQGFDIRVHDATSEDYLGEKYDVVVLGDVIEHVDNPVNLIRFAMRHLNQEGEVIVKTPNVYYIDNIIRFVKNRNYPNFEHIAWFSPSMALEIARRVDCQLKSYVVFPKKRPWPYIFPKSDVFTRDYVFIFNHPSR